MNRIRQLVDLIREKDDAPVLVAARQVEQQQLLWQDVTRRIIEDSKKGSPGPLLAYIRGAGTRRERPS